MKKVLLVFGLALLAAMAGFQLYKNKKHLDEKQKVVKDTSAIYVKTFDVALRDFDQELNYSGTFEANKELVVLSETSGKVIKTNFEEGDQVSAGKTIAQTDKEILEANKAIAEANIEKLSKDLARTEALVKGKAATDVQLQEIKLAYTNAQSNLIILKKQISNTNIVAPISGTISKKFVETGSILMPGSQVAYITDISKLKLNINVSESDIIKYKEGNKINIQTDVYGDKIFVGTVSLLGVKSNSAKMFPIEISVSNDSKFPLKAGMYGRTKLSLASKSQVMAIPRIALQGSLKSPQVYVVENNKAVLRNISLGISSGEMLEVTSGLQVGEKIVVSGQINLVNNAQVSINN